MDAPRQARRAAERPRLRCTGDAPYPAAIATNYRCKKPGPSYDSASFASAGERHMAFHHRAFLNRFAAATLGAAALLAMAGCGAEVAGGAAVVGGLQAEQAAQARVQQAKVIDGMKAAQDAGMARTASAAD
jgi:hypothetical protein